MHHIKNVLPTFHIIAETKINEDGIRAFFKDDPKFFTNLEEKNRNKVTDAEKLIEVIGNVVRKLSSNSTSNNKEYISRLKHIQLNILRHIHITVAFNNVSQIFIDKLYRMRVNMEINQRELEDEKLKFWLLPTFEDNEKLAFKFAEIFDSYGALKHNLEDELSKLKDRNVEKDIDCVKRLIPNTYALDAVVTTNLLTWIELILEYTDYHYDDEIRYVLLFLAKSLKQRYTNALSDLILVEKSNSTLGLDSLKIDGKIWRNAKIARL